MALIAATPESLLALGWGVVDRTDRALAAARRLHAALSVAAEHGLVTTADVDLVGAVAVHAARVAALDRFASGVGWRLALADDEPLVTWFGDPATAHHVAILVPGVGTDVGVEAPALRAGAKNLYDAARSLTDRGDLAVIAWFGYDAPDGVDALLDGAASDGGDAFARFVDELPLMPGATTTVVGYSYGSLVAATALRRGMTVDDVVVVGSPGLGVDNVRELGADRDHFFAERAPLDLVALSEAFGRDPADPRFGATRLDTGDGPAQPTGHSSYFEAGSEALANVAAVVASRYDLLDVVQPSVLERSYNAADEACDDTVGWAKQGAEVGLDAADQVLEELEDALPSGPWDPVVGAAAAAREGLFTGAERALDLGDRLGPDLVGDVVGDIAGLFGE